MLKSAHGWECFRNKCVLVARKIQRENRKWHCKSRWWKQCWLRSFYAKHAIHHEFVPEKQSVSGKFKNIWLRNCSLEFVALRMSFRKWVLVSSVRQCAGVLFRRSHRVSGESRDPLLFHHTPLIYRQLTLYFQILYTFCGLISGFSFSACSKSSSHCSLCWFGLSYWLTCTNPLPALSTVNYSGLSVFLRTICL
jgi:hypothetical protein